MLREIPQIHNLRFARSPQWSRTPPHLARSSVNLRAWQHATPALRRPPRTRRPATCSPSPRPPAPRPPSSGSSDRRRRRGHLRSGPCRVVTHNPQELRVIEVGGPRHRSEHWDVGRLVLLERWDIGQRPTGHTWRLLHDDAAKCAALQPVPARGLRPFAGRTPASAAHTPPQRAGPIVAHALPNPDLRRRTSTISAPPCTAARPDDLPTCCSPANLADFGDFADGLLDQRDSCRSTWTRTSRHVRFCTGFVTRR